LTCSQYALRQAAARGRTFTMSSRVMASPIPMDIPFMKPEGTIYVVDSSGLWPHHGDKTKINHSSLRIEFPKWRRNNVGFC